MSPVERRALDPARLDDSSDQRSVLTWKRYLMATGTIACIHGSGLVDDFGLVLLSVVAPIAIAIGVRRHRPTSPWPWILLIVAGISWSAAGALRAATEATGDLTAGRSLVPDVFAIGGYVLFAVALLKMLRAQGQRSHTRSLALDGGILALSAMLICWVTLMAPVLYHLDAAWIAKVSIAIYPAISAILVFIAARLAFGSVAQGLSQRLLLVGMMLLLVGDIVFVPLEAGVVENVPGRLLELPYALAFAVISAAALHPSMLDTVRPKISGTRTHDRRIALVAVALLTPALMLFVWSPNNMVERVVVGVLALALAISAILRVVLAARVQAVVEDRLALQATTDQLTGLINRPAVHELVDQQLDLTRETGEPLALLFVDLDRFKLVNDSYGHAVGDDLLLAAADRLRQCAGPNDTVARLSGDEFLVVIPTSNPTNTQTIATRICDAFAKPFELIGTAWVTASIGGAIATSATNTDAATLIRDADTAMYEAKAAGRGGFIMFDPTMRDQSDRQLEMYHGLHLAIDRDEFDVHYQPIIDAPTGTVHGLEALVRWESPNGTIMPDQFIPLAEDSGLIATIGQTVMERACDQVARWRLIPGNDNLTLSVNVSARQIINADLVTVVKNALNTSGLNPNALWLEITESVMMADTLATATTLNTIRDLGVHLSVDDFGTGNSSLTYLQRFPVEQVKIDRQFVAGMLNHTEDAAIVAAVQGIAHALDLSLVAEGVETHHQEQQLIKLGCKLLQGYLYARPLPAIDIDTLLTQRNIHPNTTNTHQPTTALTVRSPGRRSPQVIAGFPVDQLVNGVQLGTHRTSHGCQWPNPTHLDHHTLERSDRRPTWARPSQRVRRAVLVERHRPHRHLDHAPHR